MIGPLGDLRATFGLRTGAMTTLERFTACAGGPPAALWTAANRADLLAEQSPALPVNQLPDSERCILVSGRCARFDWSLPDQVNEVCVDEDGEPVAMCINRDAAERALASLATSQGAVFMRQWVTSTMQTRTIENLSLLSRPWHVLREARANLAGDLQILADRIASGVSMAANLTALGHESVTVAEDAKIDPLVAVDTSDGPVVIDAGVHVGSFTLIEGPAYVGPGTLVFPHSLLRPNTIIGPACKIGGEIGGSIFQSFSNKGHYGYVGDSYVGQWVNLGAGTVTSNLKNTYGEVTLSPQPGAPAEPTGMQFLGSIIGDHVKTAIGTRLLTGTIVGTGAMIALSGLTPKQVDRFAFLTDQGADRYDLDRFITVVGRVLERRGLPLTQTLADALAQLHLSRGD
jgi:UDP-N-acetylglucosamine diphosphorylase/glucosamine-1-phosphate N-acetyltransferase